MKKITKKILGFVFFLLGAILLINYQTGITGSFLGYDSTTYLLPFLIGFVFLALGIIIFSSTLTPLRKERKIEVPNSIKQPRLWRLAKVK